MKPILSLDALAQNQKDTLLIVFGKPPRIRPASLTHFVAQGGNLLVVTDFQFVSGLGINVSGERIEQPDPFRYGGKPQCPLLRSAWGGKHPLFAPLHKEIATNCPSSATIGTDARGVQPLLTFYNEEKGEHRIPLPLYGRFAEGRSAARA